MFLKVYFYLSLICPLECTFGLSGRINEVNLSRNIYVTALTGFSYKKMYGRFAGTKKSGRIDEVAVLTRWPYGGVPLYVLFGGFSKWNFDDLFS